MLRCTGPAFLIDVDPTRTPDGVQRPANVLPYLRVWVADHRLELRKDQGRELPGRSIGHRVDGIPAHARVRVVRHLEDPIPNFIPVSLKPAGTEMLQRQPANLRVIITREGEQPRNLPFRRTRPRAGDGQSSLCNLSMANVICPVADNRTARRWPLVLPSGGQ